MKSGQEEDMDEEWTEDMDERVDGICCWVRLARKISLASCLKERLPEGLDAVTYDELHSTCRSDDNAKFGISLMETRIQPLLYWSRWQASGKTDGNFVDVKRILRCC